TPTAMPMQMHMLGAMWAPTDALTLMGMVPFVSATMDHVSRMSLMADPDAVAFTTESGGLGDVTLAALYVLARPERQRVHAGLGVSLPTGSVEERDRTPMGEDQLLPYPMQTGSGTVDLRPSLTYLGQATAWSWGAQARAVVRLTDNTFEYRFGNVYAGTAWAARRLHEALSLSLRADAQTWGDVSNDLSGTNELPYESAVEGRVVPTVFPDLRGGTRLDLSLGLNAEVPGGPLHGVRLAAEVGRPVYQSLDGPQLETDWVVTVGAQYAFAL
ncbi:MAG: transporter, partial [Rubricoccaceae bacterium]|nr:transporter [Rubricoccaceae bacterium]